MTLPTRSRLLALAITAMFVSGCAISPTPFEEKEFQRILQDDRDTWVNAMEPVAAPICLDEAIARALKYNLDHRVHLLEQVQASDELRAGRFDMLPNLMANAGYHSRDEENIRNSIDSVTGEPSLANPSISSDRQRATADLTLSWSILDFGLGYFTAKQNADRLLVANERRRRALHLLTQDVTTAYWRALAAQQLKADVRQTIREAEAALDNAQEILRAQLRDPAEMLRYQRNLLENLRLLENVDRELEGARIELASLMGLPPGTAFELIEPGPVELRNIGMNTEELEVLALSRNADLREQGYNARIAAQETRKTLLRMMPGLSFTYGLQYDGDSYLINQQWSQASLNVNYNLLNLLSGPAHRSASRSALNVAEARRMAVQMAVLTQLHLAKHHYHDALRQFERSQDIFEVDLALSDLARSQERTQMGSPLERISRDVTRILSSVRMYQSMARVNEASAQIQAVLGLEPHISSLDTVALTDLQKEVIQSFDAMDVGVRYQWRCQPASTFELAPMPTPAPPPAKSDPNVEVITLNASLLFDFESSKLRSQAFQVLDEWLKTIRNMTHIEFIEVVGHTDNLGSLEFNRDLSLQRAEAVLAYLLENGLRPSMIGTYGAAFNEPIASNDTHEGRQQNRRVEIHIHRELPHMAGGSV